MYECKVGFPKLMFLQVNKKGPYRPARGLQPVQKIFDLYKNITLKFQIPEAVYFCHLNVSSDGGRYLNFWKSISNQLNPCSMPLTLHWIKCMLIVKKMKQNLKIMSHMDCNEIENFKAARTGIFRSDATLSISICNVLDKCRAGLLSWFFKNGEEKHVLKLSCLHDKIIEFRCAS